MIFTTRKSAAQGPGIAPTEIDLSGFLVFIPFPNQTPQLLIRLSELKICPLCQSILPHFLLIL